MTKLRQDLLSTVSARDRLAAPGDAPGERQSSCANCGTAVDMGQLGNRGPVDRMREMRRVLGAIAISRPRFTGSLQQGFVRSVVAQRSTREAERFAAFFNFCLECRRYVCSSCWNYENATCRSCASAGLTSVRMGSTSRMTAVHHIAAPTSHVAARILAAEAFPLDGSRAIPLGAARVNAPTVPHPGVPETEPTLREDALHPNGTAPSQAMGDQGRMSGEVKHPAATIRVNPLAQGCDADSLEPVRSWPTVPVSSAGGSVESPVQAQLIREIDAAPRRRNEATRAAPAPSPSPTRSPKDANDETVGDTAPLARNPRRRLAASSTISKFVTATARPSSGETDLVPGASGGANATIAILEESALCEAVEQRDEPILYVETSSEPIRSTVGPMGTQFAPWLASTVGRSRPPNANRRPWASPASPAMGRRSTRARSLRSGWFGGPGQSS